MCMLLLVSTLTVLFDISRALSLPPSDPICGPNEMQSNCYNDCQLTCENRVRGYKKYCTEDCSRVGCVCLPAHYRHDNGTCVLQEECPPPLCLEGEVYNPCGTSCSDTCEERGKTCQIKPLRCVEGCFCPEGYFRDANGTCIPADQCPPRTCDGPNEYFDECPTLCPDADHCSSFLFNIPCPDSPNDGEDRLCEPRCRCKDGYYRSTEGICIPANQCADEFDGFAQQWLTEQSSEQQDD